MIYCYHNLPIYWSDEKRAKFKAFHVTPYLDKILAQGALRPPSQTGEMVLGEHLTGETIRGCMLSFFDNFQNAMNACYTLALFALIEKKLLSTDQFINLVRKEIERQGGLDKSRFKDMDADLFLQIMYTPHLLGDATTVFNLLERSLDRFINPSILGKKWVEDLPNSVEGVLDSIGVIEVQFDRKFIADPSLLESGHDSELYGFTEPKGDFGQPLEDIQLLYGDNNDTTAFDHASRRAVDAAKWVNKVCDQGSVVLEVRNINSDIEDIFGLNADFDEVDHPEYGLCLQYEDEISFVSKVTVDIGDLALWNPEEHEWRIPVVRSIPVDSKNVIAKAKDIASALGSNGLTIESPVYIRGTEVRGRRKNPKKLRKTMF